MPGHILREHLSKCTNVLNLSIFLLARTIESNEMSILLLQGYIFSKCFSENHLHCHNENLFTLESTFNMLFVSKMYVILSHPILIYPTLQFVIGRQVTHLNKCIVCFKELMVFPKHLSINCICFKITNIRYFYHKPSVQYFIILQNLKYGLY